VLGTRNLGFPSMIGRIKKATFKYVKDHIWNIINSWSSWYLSQVGRQVLIKSILQSIPPYVVSMFLLPETLINEMEKMLNFGNSRGQHWLSWECLTAPKVFGVMGV